MKNKIIAFLFMSYILAFSILHIIIPDDTISASERRILSKFPNFQLSSDYITKVEKYLLDHFPYRDTYRSIKATFNYDILHRLDNNGIYLKDNYIYKSNYPTNKESIDNFITQTNKIKDLLNEDNKTYIMIIPDKNYYLDDQDFLQIDYDYLYNEIRSLNIESIDIRNLLSLNDYYQTDTHWKQENLDKIVFKMSNIMDFDYAKSNYSKKEYDNFYGVYYGESAIKRNPEKLTYLTDSIIDNATVKYLENNSLTSVYNADKLTGLDSYEVYLDGASSFIEIENPDNKIGRELVIFRDSFASSLTPLLIKYYSKITLIDNRYISSDNFQKLISFTNQDIIFIYSTLIVNKSNTLKG